MTYDEFKTYLADFLWKENDQSLLNRMDSLIRMGESSLNRDWRTERRHSVVTVPLDTLAIPLPDDYYSIRSVSDTTDKTGEWNYVEPAEIYAIRDRTNLNGWQPVYAIEDKMLLVSGPYQAATVPTAAVDYRAKVPAFQALNDADPLSTSWVAEDFLDLYTYAVLKHTAPFLREDERVQMWESLYQSTIAIENENAAHEQERGVYAPMPLPRAAGVARRGERRRGLYPRNGQM